MNPSVVVPLSYFDYDSWDKVTKPATFNMNLDDFPAQLQERAQRQTEALAHRIEVETRIYNGRHAALEMSLDTTGFSFESAPTGMTGEDFYDVRKVHGAYFPECIDLVKCITGASAVLPFDYTVRSRSRVTGGNGVSEPVCLTHNDNTVRSGPRRARELLKRSCPVEDLLRHRYAVMNVWRRWDGGNDMPLAVCSGDSLAPDHSDLVAADLVYRNRTGEIYHAVHNPNQSFFWFPDMTADEAIVLKVYDSEAAGETAGPSPRPQACWTLHSAFEHPGHSHASGAEARSRESIEVRVLVLWAPEALAQQAELKGVTGGFAGDQFFDAATGTYMDAEDAGSSTLMRHGQLGSHDYSEFQVSRRPESGA